MINFNVPPFVGKEQEYIKEVIENNHKLCGDGPFTKKCNAWFEEKFETPKALLTTSCTHALEMAAILAGIQPGDELDIEEDDDDKQPVMKVLAPDGSTQMELEGGERIFSRKNTKTLIKMAKRAYSSELDKDYKALGKKVFKYLHIQDTNTPEYVDTPKSKED